MKKTIQLTATLTIIATIAAFAITTINSKTMPVIEEINQEKVKVALNNLFPSESVAPDSMIITQKSMPLQGDDTLEFWAASTKFVASDTTSENSEIRPDSTMGYAFKGSAVGYSSTIQYLLGVSLEGEIIGIQILSQGETPGLGSRCLEQVTDATLWNGLFKKREVVEPWFQQQFKELTVEGMWIATDGEWKTLSTEEKEELRNTNGITAITGATVTTMAIRNSLEAAASLIDQITTFLEVEEQL